MHVNCAKYLNRIEVLNIMPCGGIQISRRKYITTYLSLRNHFENFTVKAKAFSTKTREVVNVAGLIVSNKLNNVEWAEDSLK